jgi:predicted transcriptional regulator
MDTALLSNLPPELQSGNLFCVWHRAGRNKVPCQALSGRKARTNQPKHWTSLDSAIHVIDAGLHGHQWAGIGRLCNYDQDSILALDIDHCILEDGSLNAYARRLVDSASTYTEVTPSGRGIRIIFKAALPDDCGVRSSKKLLPKRSILEYPKMEVQLFVRRQYVTISGQHVPGTPANIALNQDFLTELLDLRSADPSVRKTRRSSMALQASASDRNVDSSKANPKRTNARIAHMCRTGAVFRKNWFRYGRLGKTDSEYQHDLVDHAYVRYQMSRADLLYMCKRWCRLHHVAFRPHRMDSWLLDAEQAFKDSGRQSYREYETERKRAYRRRRSPTTHPHTVGIRDTHPPPSPEGGRTNQILAMRAEGKSQRQIAKELKLSRSTVQTLLRDHRAKHERLAQEGPVVIRLWDDSVACLERDQLKSNATPEYIECDALKESELQRLYTLVIHSEWDPDTEQDLDFDEWKEYIENMCAQQFEDYCVHLETYAYGARKIAAFEKWQAWNGVADARHITFRESKRQERYNFASMCAPIQPYLYLFSRISA